MTNPQDPRPVSPAVQIDAMAPDFVARSTKGAVRLSDYRGGWLVFFSHPADFTPVCTSEFVAFQNARPEFSALNVSLLGLSVDSVFAHLAWIKDIEARFKVKIDFPIIEDISMEIARAYGMVHDQSMNTAAVRSVFFIDPHGRLRAMIHYPFNVGRSVDEIIRVVTALQTADQEDVATPEGWRPGDAPVLPPPLSQDEADARDLAGGDSWYFTPVGGAR